MTKTPNDGSAPSLPNHTFWCNTDLTERLRNFRHDYRFATIQEALTMLVTSGLRNPDNFGPAGAVPTDNRGNGDIFLFRTPDARTEALLTAFRRAQGQLSISEALRRLVTIGLDVIDDAEATAFRGSTIKQVSQSELAV
jgi:hypothetical protein